MQFQSLEYILFLVAVIGLHFTLPHKYRWVMLLVASYIFYAAWRVSFLWLLLLSTVTDYCAGLRLEKCEDPRGRRLILGVSLFVNLGLLIFFKYVPPLWDGVRWGLIHIFSGNPADLQHFDVLLPLGISFYTFQTLSYTIDVYRRRIPAEHHFGYFALYVAFFPQLLAGPIERASVLLTQLKARKHFSWGWCEGAYFLILLGMIKKMVIADRISQMFSPIVQHPDMYSSLTVFLTPPATVYQYYCDLSGYADIAIGSAILLGVQLSQNFDRPFSATSTIRFWYRWHITVTQWFRDYLMRAFTGGGSVATARPIPLMVTGLVIGIWHAPALGWLIAGASVSLLALPEIAWTRWRIRHHIQPKTSLTHFLWDWCGRFYVWGVVFYLIGLPLTWGHLKELSIITGKMAHFQTDNGLRFPDTTGTTGIVFLAGMIVLLEVWQWADANGHAQKVWKRVPLELRWLWGAGLAVFALIFANLAHSGFLYFKF